MSDEGGPFAAARQGEAANRRPLRRVNAWGGERRRKRRDVIASGVDREGERKRTTVVVSKCRNWHRNRGQNRGGGMSLGDDLLAAQVVPGIEVARARSRRSYETWELARRYAGGPEVAGPGQGDPQAVDAVRG